MSENEDKKEILKRKPTYPVCRTCGKQFLYEEELTEHLRVAHNFVAKKAVIENTVTMNDMRKEMAEFRKEMAEREAALAKREKALDERKDKGDKGEPPEESVDAQVGGAVN